MIRLMAMNKFAFIKPVVVPLLLLELLHGHHRTGGGTDAIIDGAMFDRNRVVLRQESLQSCRTLGFLFLDGLCLRRPGRRCSAVKKALSVDESPLLHRCQDDADEAVIIFIK